MADFVMESVFPTVSKTIALVTVLIKMCTEDGNPCVVEEIQAVNLKQLF